MNFQTVILLISHQKIKKKQNFDDSCQNHQQETHGLKQFTATR